MYACPFSNKKDHGSHTNPKKYTAVPPLVPSARTEVHFSKKVPFFVQTLHTFPLQNPGKSLLCAHTKGRYPILAITGKT